MTPKQVQQFIKDINIMDNHLNTLYSKPLTTIDECNIQLIILKNLRNNLMKIKKFPPEFIVHVANLRREYLDAYEFVKTEITRIRIEPAVVDMENLYIDPSQTCVICQEEFEGEKVQKVLVCNHMFHAICIFEWFFHSNKTCPICRSVAVQD